MDSRKKLKGYLKRFGRQELITILGDDLVDQLIEWDSPTLTKALLVEMIDCIHGLSILRNKAVRRRVLEQMPQNDLESFRRFVSNDYSENANTSELVTAVAERPWRDSDINRHFVELLDCRPEAVFEAQSEIGPAVESVSAHEKFYELLDYQYIIRQKALSILESGNPLSRFLIHMPTGTGKTKTATHIACHFLSYDLKKKGLILWVAHTKELLQQAYEAFVQVWRNIGDGDVLIYRLWDEYQPEIPDSGFNGIMVCGIQKLQAIKSGNPDLFEQVHKDLRLLIFDEAHKASATETKRTIEYLMTRPNRMLDRSLMGLTATPGRTTEFSIDNTLLASMFGNKIIGIDVALINTVNNSPQEALNIQVEDNIIRYFQERKILSKIVREELVYPQSLTEEELDSIRVDATSNGYDDYTKSSLELIGRNRGRNLTIKKKLQLLNEQGIPTIVFACSVAHAQLLSAMLTLDGVPNAIIIGDMPAQERANSIKRFKDVNDNLNMLINYEVLTTGFDATNIGCVFIARPTKSIVLYSQMLGRGLRGPQMGGGESCLLVDIKDNLKRFDGESTYRYFSMYWDFGRD